jgi:hypothetical protein
VFPSGVFYVARLTETLYVGDRQARTDGQRGELINRIAAGLPIREFIFIKGFRHVRVPFPGHRPDHDAGLELPAIDAHRTAEAAADVKRRFDDGVTRARRGGTGSKYVTLRGGRRRAIPFLLVRSGRGARDHGFYTDKTVPRACLCLTPLCGPAPERDLVELRFKDRR